MEFVPKQMREAGFNFAGLEDLLDSEISLEEYVNTMGPIWELMREYRTIDDELRDTSIALAVVSAYATPMAMTTGSAKVFTAVDIGGGIADAGISILRGNNAEAALTIAIELLPELLEGAARPSAKAIDSVDDIKVPRIHDTAEGTSKTVDDFLGSNVPKQYQTQVKNAFGSDAKVTTLKQDTTVHRYYGGVSAPSSYWVTPNKVNNPISELALPPGNTAQYVDTIVLKKGTTVLEGTVARNFGQPGGGYQYYVPGMK